MKVCFEGIDGCGKSTQAKMLMEALERTGLKPYPVKHPGQTEFGRALRELILYGPQPKSDLAHRLLFWADLIETTVQYQEESVIIFDRHPRYSNYAYSAGMPDFNEDMHYALLDTFWEWTLEPDITFVVDVPVKTASARVRQRNKELTAVEKRGELYFERVRSAYQKLGETCSEVVIVDGTRDPLEVYQEILHEVKKKFNL
jgi:dTMP kinase